MPQIDQFKQTVDPENTQIILKSLFLNQLFPIDESNSSNQQLTTPFNGKPFLIYHYNGLPRSNQNNRVRYASAQAVISDYGYGNDIPAHAAQPVPQGFHLSFVFICNFCVFQRNLSSNNRSVENEMANNRIAMG